MGTDKTWETHFSPLQAMPPRRSRIPQALATGQAYCIQYSCELDGSTSSISSASLEDLPPTSSFLTFEDDLPPSTPPHIDTTIDPSYGNSHNLALSAIQELPTLEAAMRQSGPGRVPLTPAAPSQSEPAATRRPPSLVSQFHPRSQPASRLPRFKPNSQPVSRIPRGPGVPAVARPRQPPPRHALAPPSATTQHVAPQPQPAKRPWSLLLQSHCAGWGVPRLARMPAPELGQSVAVRACHTALLPALRPR